MELFYKIVFGTTAVGGFLIVLLLYLKKPRPKFNVLYLWLNVTMALWAAGRYLMLEVGNHDAALFVARLFYFGSVMVHIFFLHTVLVFLDHERKHRPLIWIFYVNAAIILVFNLVDLWSGSGFFIRDVAPKMSFKFFEVPGPIYLLHLINYLFIPLYVFIEMLQGLRRMVGAELEQLRYILLASVFGFVGGNSVVPLVYGFPLEPVFVIMVPLHLLGMYIAVTKHRLFDVKVITTEVLIFAIWVFLFVRSLVADTPADRWANIVLFALMIFFGVLLIRSVLKEVESREKIQALATDLAAANEELKKLDAAKSEFISIAGHQLRTPLTVIKGYASMVMEGSFGEIGEKAKEAINKVFISSVTLTKLVSDLLDLSRIEAGKIRYEMKEMKLDDVVYGVLGELQETAAAKAVTLKFSNQNLKNKTIFADIDKIHELVINLVDNAIKYSEKGRVDVGLTEILRDGKTFLQFSVKDTGMGIKPDDLPKLFAKFVRSEEARKVRPDGMGIGLYFAKKIVEDHHGRIWAESPGLGKGSTFFVEIPIH